METLLLALLPTMMSQHTEKSLAVGSLVVYKQPGPKNQKDEEDGKRLKEDLLPAPSPAGY